MGRTNRTVRWLAILSVSLFACNTAYADRIAEPPRHRAPVSQTPEQSPYQVELIGQNGLTLDTYQHRGRYYVLGDAGNRYTIRVSNPTSRRIEAVVSVDGLDVIDGKTADLGKRGYVVPAFGELRIEGFRVSTRQVATFRFSSVSNSYAGRKGKARNVGVIGVAIFKERSEPDMILADPAGPVNRRHNRRHDRRYDRPHDRRHRERSAGSKKSRDVEYDLDIELEAEEAPAADKGDAASDDGYYGGAPSASPGNTGSSRPAPRRSAEGRASGGVARKSRSDVSRGQRCCGARPQPRPGLGTEYGERRQSAASWTRLVRANAKVPSAMAQLRYNDSSGLRALGIRLDDYHVDEDELATRETANPFPGSPFAAPPPSR